MHKKFLKSYRKFLRRVLPPNVPIPVDLDEYQCIESECGEIFLALRTETRSSTLRRDNINISHSRESGKFLVDDVDISTRTSPAPQYYKHNARKFNKYDLEKKFKSHECIPRDVISIPSTTISSPASDNEEEREIAINRRLMMRGRYSLVMSVSSSDSSSKEKSSDENIGGDEMEKYLDSDLLLLISNTNEESITSAKNPFANRLTDGIFRSLRNFATSSRTTIPYEKFSGSKTKSVSDSDLPSNKSTPNKQPKSRKKSFRERFHDSIFDSFRNRNSSGRQMQRISDSDGQQKIAVPYEKPSSSITKSKLKSASDSDVPSNTNSPNKQPKSRKKSFRERFSENIFRSFRNRKSSGSRMKQLSDSDEQQKTNIPYEKLIPSSADCDSKLKSSLYEEPSETEVESFSDSGSHSIKSPIKEPIPGTSRNKEKSFADRLGSSVFKSFANRKTKRDQIKSFRNFGPQWKKKNPYHYAIPERSWIRPKPISDSDPQSKMRSLNKEPTPGTSGIRMKPFPVSDPQSKRSSLNKEPIPGTSGIKRKNEEIAGTSGIQMKPFPVSDPQPKTSSLNKEPIPGTSGIKRKNEEIAGTSGIRMNLPLDSDSKSKTENLYDKSVPSAIRIRKPSPSDPNPQLRQRSPCEEPIPSTSGIRVEEPVSRPRTSPENSFADRFTGRIFKSFRSLRKKKKHKKK